MIVEEQAAMETSDVSFGKDGMSSMLELRNFSHGTTVTIEDSTVLGDTSVFDPTGSKGLGHGGECC